MVNNMRLIKKLYMCILGMAMVFAISGCQKEEASAPELEEGGVSREYQEARYSVLEEPKESIVYSGVRYLASYGAGARYTLAEYDLGEAGNKFYLYKRISDMETSHGTELFSDGSFTTAAVVCMDVITEKDIALIIRNEEGLQLIHLDEDGKVNSCMDITEGYMEEGVADKLFQEKFYCDKDGNQYVILKEGLEEGYQLMVFDRDGKRKTTMDYTKKKDYYFTCGTHDRAGNLYLAKVDVEQGKTQWLEVTSGGRELQVLFELNGIANYQMEVLENGDIYYSSSGRLMYYNKELQLSTEIYDYKGSNILFSTPRSYVRYLTVSEDGEILFYHINNDATEMCFLTKDVEQTEDKIRMLNASGFAELRSAATQYSRENDVKIEYEQAGQDGDVLWNRLMAELAVGKGPDIICTDSTTEWLNVLAEKGLLENLSGMISEDIRKELFPGVVNSCTVNGEWLGLVPYGSARALITANSTWEKEQWTTQDVLALVEDKPDLKAIAISPYGSKGLNSGGSTDKEYNLNFLALHHISNSSFIDFGEGISKYDEPAFGTVLRISDKYADEEIDEENTIRMIKEGEALAYYTYVLSASDFRDLRKDFGEECHFIGYPGQQEQVGYWSGCPIIMVNKNSKYLDEIAVFLEQLLSEEFQKQISDIYINVRKDMVRSFVTYQDYNQTWTYRGIDFTKEDGSSYVEDYIDFLSKLGVEINPYEAVNEIVETEAEDYFSGNKQIGQVQEIIDNRIQLYLDERK